MGTSDNAYVSNLKYCHYLMYFLCFSLFFFFNYLMSYLFHFPVLVMIVCGQMKQTFAPNLGRHAAHLGGTVMRLLDKIRSSSSGVEASRFLNSSVLPYSKPGNASKWGEKESEHSCFIVGVGAK